MKAAMAAGMPTLAAFTAQARDSPQPRAGFSVVGRPGEWLS
jgi:hypothetical protein